MSKQRRVCSGILYNYSVFNPPFKCSLIFFCVNNPQLITRGETEDWSDFGQVILDESVDNRGTLLVMFSSKIYKTTHDFFENFMENLLNASCHIFRFG